MNIEKNVQETKINYKIKYFKTSKKPKEKWIDYFYRIKFGKCDYCNLTKKKREFKLIKKYDDSNSNRINENRRNIVLICKSCVKVKKNMTHNQFKDYLRKRKQEVRKEMRENYKKYKKIVFKSYNRECIFCVYEFGHTPSERKLTIEHKKPIGGLGDNSLENLSCACYEHNYEKSNKTADEYFVFLKNNNRKKSKLN